MINNYRSTLVAAAIGVCTLLLSACDPDALAQTPEEFFHRCFRNSNPPDASAVTACRQTAIELAGKYRATEFFHRCEANANPSDATAIQVCKEAALQFSYPTPADQTKRP